MVNGLLTKLFEVEDKNITKIFIKISSTASVKIDDNQGGKCISNIYYLIFEYLNIYFFNTKYAIHFNIILLLNYEGTLVFPKLFVGRLRL